MRNFAVIRCKPSKKEDLVVEDAYVTRIGVLSVGRCSSAGFRLHMWVWWAVENRTSDPDLPSDGLECAFSSHTDFKFVV